jgi:hypothetical protein
MPGGLSTVLNIQQSLFKRTDPNIISNLTADQTTLIASNISEETFVKLPFVTNSPAFKNSYMYLLKIQVYLGAQSEPTEIFGLLPIVQQRIENSDSLAYSLGEPVNNPFTTGFKGGKTIGEIVDTLSSLSRNIPDTYGVPKRFTFYIDPIGETDTIASSVPPT